MKEFANGEKAEKLKSILFKSAITIVLLSAFLLYFAQMTETSAYFTDRVVSSYQVTGSGAVKK